MMQAKIAQLNKMKANGCKGKTHTKNQLTEMPYIHSVVVYADRN